MIIDNWQLPFLAITLLYFFQALFVCFGLWMANKTPKNKPKDKPFVSIIVAARNESNNIAKTLESILAIDYPTEKFEIFVVDDDSHDNTSDIVSKFCAKHNHVKLIQSRERIANLNGKASAIHTALQETMGEFIFITDADCRVPANWVKSHLLYYTTETGMVGGFTLLTDKEAPSNLFARIQSLEWLFATSVGSGFSGLKKPLGIFGNNLSFRRDAYDLIGGFPNIGFSLVEDYALMNAIKKQTDYKIILQPEPEMIVQTNPVDTLKKLYLQRKRWAIGSRGFSFSARFLMLLSFIAKIIPLILVILNTFLAAIIALLIILFSDFLILIFAVLILQRKEQLRSFFLFELFVIIYPLILAPFFLFSHSVNWKERKYTSQNIKK